MLKFSKTSLPVLSFIPATARCSPFMENKYPNIVIILADDQGWRDLSISGNTNVKTPHIDRLAKKGVIFDRFYVCPVSSPTRAELLTGRYHPRGGVFSTSAGGERLDLDEITIADYFKKAGYSTAAYGKWHNGTQPPYHPNARGFDDFYGFCSGHWGGKTSVRNQRFRLDHEGKLFDIPNDPEQNEDVSNKYPEITNTLLGEKAKWEKEVLSELSKPDTRPFTIGYPEFTVTHIPARDGIAKGNIRRSNKFPNDFYFTNWTSTSDSIVWKIDVLADGCFDVEIYYTCPPEDIGATVELSFADKNLSIRSPKHIIQV